MARTMRKEQDVDDDKSKLPEPGTAVKSILRTTSSAVGI